MKPFIVFYILFVIVVIAFCIAYTLLRKPSKKVRNKIYKTMLQQYSILPENSCIGLCSALKRSTISAPPIDAFPELIKYKPIKTMTSSEYWFPTGPEGRETRMHILKWAIEETK